MFGIVRRKSRTELVRQELGQGMDHFKQAATHAALGTGATVGPKFTAARDRVQPAAGRVMNVASNGWGGAVATLAPLAAAATKGACQAEKNTKKADKVTKKNTKELQKATAKALARKRSGRKRSKLTSLLLAGAAVGAAGAYAMRRRKDQQWDEYDPSRPDTSTGLGASYSPDDAALKPADLSGPSGFAGDTGPTVSSATTARSSTVSDPLIASDQADQTSSTLHSPKVAGLTKGTKQP